MSEAASQLDTARTVVAVVIGAAAVIGVVVVLVVIALYREKRIRAELTRQADALAALQRDLDDKRKGASKFETLEDLMKPYKKHLLQSAFDLQSRLFQQVSNNFLNNFSKRSKRDGEYAVESTTYFFAEFLGWLEVIRRQVVFVTGSEYAESLNSLLDSIRFQLTGERDMQGCNKGCKVNDVNYDVNSDVLQLYIVDIRSIGNAMLHWDDSVHDNNKPMTVDMFLQRIKGSKDNLELVRPMTVDMFLQRIKSDDPKFQPFKEIMKPLYDSITRLATLQARVKDGAPKPPDYAETKIAPIRRLAILQVLLCKLIDILDNAVPWDFGPKYDKDDEPRYIQRDIRFTPLVKFLSEKQKAYLASQPFFEDDRQFSFPGFREDMAHMTQAERDELLWPGSCPPREPRKRDEAYKRNQPYTQGTAVGTLGLRKRNGLSAISTKPLAQVQVQQVLARTRSVFAGNRRSVDGRRPGTGTGAAIATPPATMSGALRMSGLSSVAIAAAAAAAGGGSGNGASASLPPRHPGGGGGAAGGGSGDLVTSPASAGAAAGAGAVPGARTSAGTLSAGAGAAGAGGLPPRSPAPSASGFGPAAGAAGPGPGGSGPLVAPAAAAGAAAAALSQWTASVNPRGSGSGGLPPGAAAAGAGPGPGSSLFAPTAAAAAPPPMPFAQDGGVGLMQLTPPPVATVAGGVAGVAATGAGFATSGSPGGRGSPTSGSGGFLVKGSGTGGGRGTSGSGTGLDGGSGQGLAAEASGTGDVEAALKGMTAAGRLPA